jgi:hypothetical protein
MVRHPLRVGLAELIESQPQGFQHVFKAVERTNGRQHMRRIGPLGAACLDPSPRFARSQEGVQEPLGGVMGEQTFPKIVQQRAIEAVVVQVEAQRIFPIHAAAHGIGGLAVGEPFHIPYMVRDCAFLKD